MTKKIEDYPIEDMFGIEIHSGDVYFEFGKELVLEINLKRYLIENQQIKCYQAQD